MENKAEDRIWIYECLSYSGAVSMAKVVRDKWKCELFEKPIEKDNGKWVVMFSNPLLINGSI